MPIHKYKDALMIEMGFGDVAVATGKTNGIDSEIVFYSGPAGEIGRDNPGDVGKTSDDVKAPLRIVFHKPESVDVVIEKLQRVKAALLGAPKPCDECGGSRKKMKLPYPGSGWEPCPKCAVPPKEGA